jgi:hypothetical protein
MSAERKESIGNQNTKRICLNISKGVDMFKVLHNGEEHLFDELGTAQDFVKGLVGEWSIVDEFGETIWDWTDRVGP